jgi:hypothetical protein
MCVCANVHVCVHVCLCACVQVSWGGGSHHFPKVVDEAAAADEVHRRQVVGPGRVVVVAVDGEHGQADINVGVVKVHAAGGPWGVGAGCSAPAVYLGSRGWGRCCRRPLRERAMDAAGASMERQGAATFETAGPMRMHSQRGL